MRVTVSAFVLVLGLSGAACSSRVCRPCDRAATPARHFVVLRASPMADPEGGPAQVFIDGSVVTVPGGRRIQTLEESARVEGKPSPVWLAGSQVPDAAFGRGARVVSGPKILALDGQDATVFVGESNRDGSIRSGWQLEVTPRIHAEQVHMTVAYRHHEGGRLVDSVPATPIEGPAGRVFILESRPESRPE